MCSILPPLWISTASNPTPSPEQAVWFLRRAIRGLADPDTGVTVHYQHQYQHQFHSWYLNVHVKVFSTFYVEYLKRAVASMLASKYLMLLVNVVHFFSSTFHSTFFTFLSTKYLFSCLYFTFHSTFLFAILFPCLVYFSNFFWSTFQLFSQLF